MTTATSCINQPHQFHIPVMGTGFTIDSPLKVAKYGISSVISLVDDVLIEQMRKFYNETFGKKHIAITDLDEDVRAKRITAYLDLLDDLLKEQVCSLRKAPFEKGSEITRYFELLPDSPLKALYHDMLSEENIKSKEAKQAALRDAVMPGTIDVNIMTKLDAHRFKGLGPEFSDALSALRGYAKSKVQSSIVFSAGFNPNLYGYIAEFEDFYPDDKGHIKKKIVLKVSDFRSAAIQSKYLAKRGIWVSEYRIESALNCGGHAFANEGILLGPILEEFKGRRQELLDTQLQCFNKARSSKGQKAFDAPLAVRFTVQGGVGTCSEHGFLMDYYKMDATGWGTPFMLVPSAVNLDEEHFKKLAKAGEEDVVLKYWSPLSILFWNLTNSASECARKERYALGKPGAPCTKGYARFSTEFTKEPLCIASYTYQKYKLEQIDAADLSSEQKDALKQEVLDKSCLCHDLAGNATLKYGIDLKATPAVCPGPNIAYFSKIASLDEMVGHIYGRLSLIGDKVKRPHMFVKELGIYVEHLQSELKRSVLGLLTKPKNKLLDIQKNLLEGVDYYQNLAKEITHEQCESFSEGLRRFKKQLEKLKF